MSHGQPSDPAPADRALAAFAARVGARLPHWQVTSATLAAPGALDRAFAQTGEDALIYPMFMTNGWFTRDALHQAIGPRHAHVLPPFGAEQGLPDLAAEWLRDVLRRQGWTASDTRLFVAAHGSGRSKQSAQDTRAFAKMLARQLPFADIRIGFVEEEPFLSDMAFDLGRQSVCLPFFAAEGGHVLEDVHEALELAQFEGVRLPPIGCAEAAPALVARTIEGAEVPA
ncbi:CbiX/SirB N-terminal domain-containing protein [Roseovarius bejariae]|uniref:CbiX/SirB N-terminal domain-containing protein n=1 Tax=Roseovarius bejariae TaxID=2576383 RepID=UPI0031B5A6CC